MDADKEINSIMHTPSSTPCSMQNAMCYLLHKITAANDGWKFKQYDRLCILKHYTHEGVKVKYTFQCHGYMGKDDPRFEPIIRRFISGLNVIINRHSLQLKNCTAPGVHAIEMAKRIKNIQPLDPFKITEIKAIIENHIREKIKGIYACVLNISPIKLFDCMTININLFVPILDGRCIMIADIIYCENEDYEYNLACGIEIIIKRTERFRSTYEIVLSDDPVFLPDIKKAKTATDDDE